MAEKNKILEINERIKIARKALGKTMAEFSAIFEIPEKTISNYERNISPVSAEYLSALHANFGINLDWLFTGEGNIFSKEREKEDIVKVPIDYENKGSCGTGTLINDNISPEYIELSKFYLKNVLKVSLSNLIVIFARGDSMEPTITDGDMLLIDKNQMTLCDGIYLIRFYNELIVKRIFNVSFELRLASDNKKYDYIPVNKNDIGVDRQVQIIGKVVWNGSKKNI